jgi:hypothetical protein
MTALAVSATRSHFPGFQRAAALQQRAAARHSAADHSGRRPRKQTYRTGSELPIERHGATGDRIDLNEVWHFLEKDWV